MDSLRQSTKHLITAMDNLTTILVAGGLVALIVIALIKTAKVVPQRQAYVVERLGKYSRTLDAGFHLLIPFIERVAYRHNLKEIALDVPSQMCITKDNIAVEIDGVLYMQVLDAKSASYGIEDYRYASIQLAQTTLRSEIGKLELDRTFEEREQINAHIIDAVDRASEPWGLKITRYEISNINPPQSVKDALEKQMRAERERRAVVAHSEGEREARSMWPRVTSSKRSCSLKRRSRNRLMRLKERRRRSRC